jgi:hypothetical protein
MANELMIEIRIEIHAGERGCVENRRLARQQATAGKRAPGDEEERTLGAGRQRGKHTFVGCSSLS